MIRMLSDWLGLGSEGEDAPEEPILGAQRVAKGARREDPRKSPALEGSAESASESP